ncbi:MAG TPA: 4Fe-4S binding protein [Actinomycetota bacterium]|nr:4Fe-4S binding protein [Actinomycetota bacterium]
MAIDHDDLQVDGGKLARQRKQTFGIGLLKGMAVTLKHLFKHNTVIEYPDVKQDLGARTRGVIALKEENCTVCMLCGRECPDWCIYIDSHKETLPPKRAGGRPRKRNVLDRFAIDYALCMYCGICVEVCPYDALFWSREYEYSEFDIRELTHEKEKLSDWMATVLPPPALEVGALFPGQAEPELAAPTPPEMAARPTSVAARPATVAPAKEAAAEAAPGEVAERIEQSVGARTSEVLEPETKEPEPERAPTIGDTPNVSVPHEAPRPVALERTEDPQAVYDKVLADQLDKGSSPQVAEARAKVARVKAERGIRRVPTPVEVDKPVPSAPTKAELGESQPPGVDRGGVATESDKVPSGAPQAEEPQPPQGPVAPTSHEQAVVEEKRQEPEPVPPVPETEPPPDEPVPPVPPTPAPEARTAEPTDTQSPPPPAGATESEADAVYERVLAEERARGASEPVAIARAKAARRAAIEGTQLF